MKKWKVNHEREIACIQAILPSKSGGDLQPAPSRDDRTREKEPIDRASKADC